LCERSRAHPVRLVGGECECEMTGARGFDHGEEVTRTGLKLGERFL
jgi:hypothetical protein